LKYKECFKERLAFEYSLDSQMIRSWNRLVIVAKRKKLLFETRFSTKVFKKVQEIMI